MASRSGASSVEGAVASSLWSILSWPLIAIAMWIVGMLLSHPWAGLSIGLIAGFFARDYFEGKSLWTLLGFGCWIAGVALHHPWIGFFVGLGLAVAVTSVIYQ